jgi:hypothetical protein
MKVFVNGRELEDEPSRDIESLLELVDKLSTDSLIEINSRELINNFYKLYGESNFIAVYDNKDSKFYECIKHLAENKFKSNFYFGVIQQNEFTDNPNKIPFPALIVNLHLI